MDEEKVSAIEKIVIVKTHEELLANKEYKKLNEKYKVQRSQGKIVQAMKTLNEIKGMEKRISDFVREDVINEMVSSQNIMNLLDEKDKIEYRKLTTMLSFCFDTMENIFMEITNVFHRNDVNVTPEQYPEILKCKEKIYNTLRADERSMNENELDAYMNTADSLYDFMYDLSGTFIDKVDKLPEESDKTSQNA